MPDEVIARFGTVNLARRADGGHALVGGTRHDQAAVKRWCSRFAPFVGFGGNPSNDNQILRDTFQRWRWVNTTNERATSQMCRSGNIAIT